AVRFGGHHHRQCRRGWARHWQVSFVPVPLGQGEFLPWVVPLNRGGTGPFPVPQCEAAAQAGAGASS
ncbi:hypothetical protein PIB30_078040, partial [Stylosanthes scabra]|nr:hypothetical protein [Stylosanthes scabra]